MNNKNYDVSVIVPLYKGEMYIDIIIQQIEKAASKANIKVQLLLINDYPLEVIGSVPSKERVYIEVVNPGINNGIHGARVLGLSLARGEFVLFLDQDDIIYEEYFESQLNAIGNADACVCQCLEAGTLFYNKRFQMDQVLNYEYLIDKGNCIVSPGHVLLKKSSIPNEWCENIMMTNCADDYFLWILLLVTNHVITANNQLLFEHVVSGTNQSGDYIRTYTSLEEMYTLFSIKGLISQDDCRRFRSYLDTYCKSAIRKLQNSDRKLRLICRIQALRHQGLDLGNLLLKEGISKVAVYGAGDVGKYIERELHDVVEVCYFIDKKKNEIRDIELPVRTIEEVNDEVDAIIISLVSGYDSIVQRISEDYKIKCIVLNDFLYKYEGKI